MTYFINKKLELEGKINFIFHFAIFADRYSGKSNYQNILNLLRKKRHDVKEVSLYYYVTYLILTYDGITLIEKEKITKNIDIENFTEEDKINFENSIEVKELRRLFKALKVEHILTKIFYHLTLLKVISDNLIFSEYYGIQTTEKMSEGIFIYEITLFPYKNLDFNSEENSQMVSEIQSFMKKYPNMFTSKQIKGMQDNKEDYSKLKTLSNSSNNFFKSFVDFANEDEFIADYLGGISSNMTAFLEFDPDFFDNVLMNIDTSDAKDSFTVEDSAGRFGSCESGYTEHTLTALTLDVVDFVKNNLEKFQL